MTATTTAISTTTTTTTNTTNNNNKRRQQRNKATFVRSFVRSLSLFFPSLSLYDDVHCPLSTVHCSLFTVHCSLFTVHCSLSLSSHCRPSFVRSFYEHCTLFVALFTSSRRTLSFTFVREFACSQAEVVVVVVVSCVRGRCVCVVVLSYVTHSPLRRREVRSLLPLSFLGLCAVLLCSALWSPTTRTLPYHFPDQVTQVLSEKRCSLRTCETDVVCDLTIVADLSNGAWTTNRRMFNQVS